MTEPISAIRNLGPKSVESFARAGLTCAGQVRALGADETYRRILAAGDRPHFIAYYALVMGLQDRPWNDLDSTEKAALRVRFDAIVAGEEVVEETRGKRVALAPKLAIELDRLGVGARC